MKPRLRFSAERGWVLSATCAAPSQELLVKVRAGLLLRGTTLTGWCRENDTHISNARNALIGTWNGPKGKAMRTRLVRAAGIEGAA